MGIRGVKKPHPLDPGYAGVSQFLARGASGVKRPHPLGSVPSRSGASQLTAESGVASVTLPGVKISALPAAGGATISDQLEANQSGTSRSITVAQVSAAVQSTLPPVDWSAITGKPSTFPPGGPASGDLNGSYPGPTIKPSVTNGQVLTTVGGVSAWAAPAGGAPSGAAGGDLAGTYPSPTIKASVGLTGAPTAPTATPSTTSTTQIATTAFVQSALPTTLPGPPTGAAGGALTGTYPNPTLVGGPLSNYALTSSIPTTLPPNGAASGDLAGSYPSPTIKANVALTGNPTAPTPTAGDNDTSIATTAFVQTAVAGATGGAATLAAGAVGYGSASNVLTGVLADFSWDSTNKRLGVGTSTPGALAEFRSATAGTKALIVRGTTTSASQDYFDVVLTDPTGGGGSALRVMGGATGINPLFQVDRAGDTQFSGWLRALSTSGLVTNGADYFALTLGNGAGGNLGLFAGLSNPTFSTFGSYGSLYMNGSSPGLPYYNNNGTTGWDRLVGETATQTLSNKTLGATTFTGAITGTAATFSGSVQAGSNFRLADGTYAYTPFNASTDTGTVRAGVQFNGNLQTLSFYTAATWRGNVEANGLLNWAGAGTFTGTVTAPGAQIQMVSVETGAVATGTTVIPLDDTIPQITEGTEFMTLAITPKSATSKLVIEVVWGGANSVNTTMTVALFQDATANALAAMPQLAQAAGTNTNFKFTHVMTSGTTSATTFRVRAGGSAAGTTTFNGAAGARLLGGVMASSIVIRETAP
jgi:hypothetical protein